MQVLIRYVYQDDDTQKCMHVRMYVLHCECMYVCMFGMISSNMLRYVMIDMEYVVICDHML